MSNTKYVKELILNYRRQNRYKTLYKTNDIYILKFLALNSTLEAPNFETYSCGWWHCDFKQKDENKIWGKYENTSVDCSTCQDRCTADNNCTAVECNNNAREECIWVKIDMCGTKDKRVHNKSYMTCEKSPSGIQQTNNHF